MSKYHAGGRMKASEWNEVSKADEHPTRVFCIYCNENIIKKIERVKYHLERCAKRKAALSETEPMPCCSSSESDITNISNLSDSNQSNVCEASLTYDKDINVENLLPSTSQKRSCMAVTSTPIKLKKQKTLSSFVFRTTPEEIEQLDLKVAKFFFSSNIPFRAADNREFKEMIKALRPGYEPPNRKAIGSTLLSKVNEEAKKSLQLDVRTKTVTLLQDGWSSVTNDPVIAHSIHNGKEAYLLSATDPGSEKKSAEYIAQLAKDAINVAKEKYNKEVSEFPVY